MAIGHALHPQAIDLAEPTIPPTGNLPDVDHLGPAPGDPHRVPGAEELEVHLLVTGLGLDVFHVVPLVLADDVDELVQEQVAIGHAST